MVILENGINREMNYSLYIHIPFCRHRCHYCDFNTYAGQEAFIPDYVDALIREFRIVSNQKRDIQLHSIYFGGGTPSIIPINLFRKLIREIISCFSVTYDCEISIEVNPYKLSQNYLIGLRSLGFNRISVGVQSTNPVDLNRLDRTHDVYDVFETIANIRKAGFDNYNLDLIFGLPWQDLGSWEKVLKNAIAFNPPHFSVYSLIIEPDTPLHSWYQKGLINTQDQDLEGEMYELTMDMLENAGYAHYEISNWSKTDIVHDYRCRHNLQYWFGYPYLGIGAGAHGFADGIRTINTPLITEYIRKLNQRNHPAMIFPKTPSQSSTEIVDPHTQMMDFMMVGLRLVKEGVSTERFNRLFGKLMMDVFKKEIDLLIEKGLVVWADGRQQNLHLTDRGVMVANQVFMVFV